MAIPAFAGMTLVGGCGSKPAEAPFAADDERIECQVAGASGFERVCAVERSTSDAGLVLTLRHPDGGFRRLLVTKDGRGVIAADGAERAVVDVAGDKGIEVALGGDRYRLPATVGKK